MTSRIAYNRCSLPCLRDGDEFKKNVKKWFHYGCTDIPAYFILHLEEIENFHYICEECVLTAYENAHSRIAKIETSIKKQQNFGTKDQNSDADNDQTGLKDESVGNGPKNNVHMVFISYIFYQIIQMIVSGQRRMAVLKLCLQF